MYDLIIIGAGTAGLTAAIYGVRAGGSVLVFEADTVGGQIINTLQIDNYPGLPEISGYDFAAKLADQAEKIGVVIRYEKVIKVAKQGELLFIYTEDGQYTSKTVIIATGSKSRKLGIDRENELIGRGISYCATCDGAFYKNKETAVIGGGNTAIEDALFLAAICTKVYLIHRRGEFRAEEKLIAELQKKGNVEFLLDSRLSEIQGEKNVEGIVITNVNTGEECAVKVNGVFIAVGRIPDNQMVADVVALDKEGYIIAKEGCETTVQGIFAAGDCRTKTVRQLTTAAGDGAVSAIGASKMFIAGK